MRLMPTKSCETGMRLAKNIYNEEGLILLAEQVELTQGMLNRLDRMGINFLYIIDSRTDDIIIEDLISDETRVKAIGSIRTNFRKLMEDASRKRGMSTLYPQLGKEFGNLMNSIIDDISSHKDAMIMLTNLSITDHYLYQHSLNVCIYSTLLGMTAGYAREELMTLGLGALLHDIGKTKISQNVLFKVEPLTPQEFAEIKRHTELGYRLLKDEPNIPLLSAHCAYQHHERLDGSGYPRGIGGNDIHEYAKLIGLIDCYDAMTSHRVYRSAMLPHQAIEILYAGCGTLFDQRIIELFRDKVALYPLGISVTLLSGEIGVVVDINADFPQRPIIRILQSSDGTELKETYEIDLSKKLTEVIIRINDLKI